MTMNRSQINVRASARGPAERLRPDQGVALVAALAMLMIFVLLGTGYVRYMRIDHDSGVFDARKARARQLAVGGVNAAIGNLREALRTDTAPEREYSLELPIYVLDIESDTLTAPIPQRVSVRIEDEAARININHAPRELLEAIGMERGQYRKLRNSLPKDSVPGASERRWLSRVDGLRTRGILETREFKKLDQDILTVYSAVDQNEPMHLLNINTASPKVLAAVFNMPLAEAEHFAGMRPFSSWQDAVAKTGRAPSTFNIRPSAVAPHAMPDALALDSHSYRIFCEATVEPYGAGGPRVTSHVEAVVVFSEAGTHEIRYWSEGAANVAPAIESEPEPDAEPGEPIVEDGAPEAPAEDDTPADIGPGEATLGDA